MSKINEVPPEQIKPDGTIITKTDNHTFITELFFNHNSKETFQDKLLKVIRADDVSD
jgi:hypothetical protein